MTKSTGVGRHPPSQRTHGYSFVGGKATAEYNAWSSMKKRCLNVRASNFKDYGGRGITIHPAWLASFEAFLADVGKRPSPRHSLDRIDNNGNYEPGNVRWATTQQQQRNRRGVRPILFDGEITTIPDLAEKFGIPAEKIRQRVNRGWSIERAVS
jgi:hypothetical protein